ncbi:MAG: hypothetical protein AB1424_01870 [Thermodesulfobacteriota bacterium]
MAKNKYRKKKMKDPQAPQSTQETPPTNRPRRPRLFEPDWRGRPFIKRTITLCTPQAQSLGNFIPGIAGAACIIGFALQRYVEDIRVLTLLESVDEEIFKTLGKDLENECARLETLIAEEGVKRETLFPHPLTVVVEITHPYGIEYAKMVENMDKLVSLLWDLHNGRIINPIDFEKAKEKWFQLIRDAGRRITTLARETLDQARQEKALKDQKEAAEAQEEATDAAAIAEGELTSAEAKEPASPEAPQAPETLPGGNGRKPRKAGKTTGQDSEAEEVGKGSGHETSMLGAGEESPPPLEQAV